MQNTTHNFWRNFVAGGWKRTCLATLRFIRGLCGWVLFSAVVGVLAGWISYLLAGTLVPLNHYYGNLVQTFGILGGAITVGGLSYVFSACPQTNHSTSPKKNVSIALIKARLRQNPIRFVLMFGVTILAVVALVSWNTFQQVEANRLSAKSESYFITTEMPGVPYFDRTSLKVELEKTRQSVSSKWGLTQASPIEVIVFPTRESYLLQARGRETASGHMQCFQDATRIYLYLSEDIEGSELLVQQSTIKHEVAHAVMCQVLTADHFHQVPDWIHEGFARSVEFGGWSHWRVQSQNRIQVWDERNSILSADQLCQVNIQRSGQTTDVDLFYAVAWEFIRWLDSSTNRDTALDIGTAILEHNDTDAAVEEVLGDSCENTFQVWKQGFVR